MSYLLAGLSVRIPPQAARPRQPSRPMPSVVLSSPELDKRFLRPRTMTAPIRAAGAPAALHQVAAAKQQQMAAEGRVRSAVATLRQVVDASTDSTQSASAVVEAQKDVDAGIAQVKGAAAAANTAALAAVQAGILPSVVRAVSQGADPSSGHTVAVESSTASVSASGAIIPGPDARVITTPTQADPGAPPAAPIPQADTHLSKNAFKWALGAGALFLLFKMVQK